jgi:hypothetical protein
MKLKEIEEKLKKKARKYRNSKTASNDPAVSARKTTQHALPLIRLL